MWQPFCPEETFDYLFKVLLIGNSSVGKTSVVNRYVKRSFNRTACPSLGIDLEVVSMVCCDKRIRLQIWDTAGQERFRALTTSFYRAGLGFILMYDVSNEESFLDVIGWLSHAKFHTSEQVRFILVGNKCDLDAQRVVSVEQGRKLAEERGLDFFETSAKSNVNIEAVFMRLVECIIENMDLQGDDKQDPAIIKGINMTQALSQLGEVKDVRDKKKCSC